MLMPILTVKTAVPAAQAVAAVESVMPTERAIVASDRISGNQSDAVLKILETLNRHLVGSDPLPKEALIRLLDTLAKILKFPPLPQETLRDFSKRLAVFLETLPPAARQALEKQLGQQNLAASLRILTDVLKTSAMIEPPRLLERVFLPTSNTSSATGSQTKQRPAQAAPPRDQLPLPVRQGPIPAGPSLSIPSTTMPDPGLLQAALKKAFGEDEDGASTPVASEDSNDTPVTGLRRDDTLSRVPATRNNSATMAAPSQIFTRVNPDGIPVLRAAAAFLATEPLAMSQVAAITSGGIDNRIKPWMEQESGLDFSEMPELQDLSNEIDGQPSAERRSREGTEVSKAQSGASANTATSLENLLVSKGPEADGFPIQEDTGEHSSSIHDTALPIRNSFNEVDGFTGHDLGEGQLEADILIFAEDAETNASVVRTEIEQPGKVLADTLKVLVEASLPLPDGSSKGISDTLFSALAGDTADMGAQALFAELDATDGTLADPALLTGDIGDEPKLLPLDEDGWTTLIDSPQDETTGRQSFAHPMATDEVARETQLPRQAETALVRDGIPFAMIPYLPAQTKTAKTGSAEDEEERNSSSDEEQHGRDENGDSRDEQEPQAAQEGQDEDGHDADTAYDLYRRMGGLG